MFSFKVWFAPNECNKYIFLILAYLSSDEWLSSAGWTRVVAILPGNRTLRTEEDFAALAFNRIEHGANTTGAVENCINCIR
jgi:hypothetical protein